MSVYVKRETLEAEIADEPFMSDSTKAVFRNIVYKTPAVDAVEVVRCKNCVRSGTTEFGKRFCKEPLGMYGSVPVDDNGFCSHGRREHDNA